MMIMLVNKAPTKVAGDNYFSAYKLKTNYFMTKQIVWACGGGGGGSYSKMDMILVHGLTNWTLNKYFHRLKNIP